MTRRRELLIALGAASLSPRVALAQSKPPVLIGWFDAASRKANTQRLSAFKEGMAALGWKESASYILEERWADGHVDRIPALAAEMAAKQPAVILAFPAPAAAAVAKATPRTPVVVIRGDPVAAGLVKSLARPGGMITGISSVNTAVTEKLLELLLAAAPKLRRIGFLLDSTAGNAALLADNARRSVAQYPVEARFAELARPEEVEAALSHLVADGARALVVMPGQAVLVERRRTVKVAQQQRWPMIAVTPEFAEEGALLSYGADRLALYRRAGYFVDRILKGAKPADLPVEQPTKFELIVNMNTAKALGLTIPQSVLVRADRVIE